MHIQTTVQESREDFPFTLETNLNKIILKL